MLMCWRSHTSQASRHILHQIRLLALPEDVIQNTSIIYYRFHGKPDLYKSPYELPFLKHVFNEVDANTKNKEAYLYFNNDIDGSAIKNARQLQKLVTGQSAKMKLVK